MCGEKKILVGKHQIAWINTNGQIRLSSTCVRLPHNDNTNLLTNIWKWLHFIDRVRDKHRTEHSIELMCAHRLLTFQFGRFRVLQF